MNPGEHDVVWEVTRGGGAGTAGGRRPPKARLADTCVNLRGGEPEVDRQLLFVGPEQIYRLIPAAEDLGTGEPADTLTPVERSRRRTQLRIGGKTLIRRTLALW
jgi:hypothetical protein